MSANLLLMPPRMSADDRRTAILTHALPIMAEKGFDAVTTKELANAAGVSEALLYRHFASKRELYEALREHCMQEATEQVHAFQNLPDNTETLILAIYLLLAKIQSVGDPDSAHFKRLMIRSVLSEGNFARGFTEGTSKPWVEKMRRCVEGAVRAGDLAGEHADFETFIWFGHHLSVAIAMFSLPDKAVIPWPDHNPVHLFERSVLFCLRGLGLRQETIDAYYRPQQYALLLDQGKLKPLAPVSDSNHRSTS